MRIGLAGGWGYNNLGDEAILAGYIEALGGLGDLVISSHDPQRTQDAQRSTHRVDQEGRLPSVTTSILAGGGYLNGSWVPEIGRKMKRLRRDFASSPNRVVSSVEVRGFTGASGASRISKLLAGANVSVRDSESQSELAALSISSDVLPDGISLLVPHLACYRQTIPELHGKVLVNLLDIARRPDASESELAPELFAEYADRTVAALGNRAIGLVIGDGDIAFMRRYRDLPLITPRTVTDLVSVLGSSAGILSVRMHPALIASAMGLPTVAVPYCGKVRPTLTNVGLDRLILTSYEAGEVTERLNTDIDFTKEWSVASARVLDWLTERLA